MKILFSFLAFFFVAGVVSAAAFGWMPATAGGPWPACLAQFTPVDGKSLGDWLIIAIAVVVIVDRILSMVRGSHASPPLHKQYTDRADHDKDIKEIKDALVSMKKDFETWSSAHYDARRRMHKKINHISTAMAYLAGSIEDAHPRTAAKLRELLKESDDQADEDE